MAADAKGQLKRWEGAASSLKDFGNATLTESQSETAAMLLRVLCILLLGVLGSEASFFNKTQAAIEEVYCPAALSANVVQY